MKQGLQSREGSNGTATKSSVASSREQRSNIYSQAESQALNVYTKKTEIIINPQAQQQAY